MQNFKYTFGTLKQSFLSAFSIYMTVPLTNMEYLPENDSISKSLNFCINKILTFTNIFLLVPKFRVWIVQGIGI